MSETQTDIILFRPVESSDESALVAILNDAKQIKEQNGDNAWGHRSFVPEEVRKLIDEGDMYIGEINGKSVATITLAKKDERIWGYDGSDGQALYIHKLARLKEYPGVGKEAMQFAETRARELGRSLLRLDNPTVLDDYYESLGFEAVGAVDLGMYQPVLREKQIND